MHRPTRPLPRNAAVWIPLALVVAFGGGCGILKSLRGGSGGGDAEVQAFLDHYVAGFQPLYYEAQKAQWNSSTDVSDDHTAAAVAANQRLSEFTGSTAFIAEAQEFRKRSSISDLQRRQLDKVLLLAAENPGSVPDIVKARVEAEARQSAALDGFTFHMDDGHGGTRVVTPNDIDDILQKSTDLDERRRAWEASKQIGPVLRDGLVRLRDLRNQVARAMGYSSFFALQVADYGMTVDEMMELLDSVVADVRPVYEQLHYYARKELARRFDRPLPRRIPAHWLGNRWGQEWPGLAEGVDLDPLFAGMKPEAVVRTAEDFYVSLGFPRLPAAFWERSDLYALPAGSERKKNTHASAWHMDLADDVRSLMSVQPNFQWFSTTHHELGHIYYYIAYSRPDVPILLREGANRAFHEGIGELISLAASQQSYLRDRGILPKDKQIDGIQWLLNDAFNSVVLLPWSAGVMSHFEHDLYEEDLPADQFNARWWEYVKKYQGIDPPAPRGEEFCDAATKTHINDDPAQYYDYALATVLKFQFHDHIANAILHKDVRDANYFGSEATGEFLRSVLEPGATRDWRDLVRDATGSPMSGRAMLAYYAPLMTWLKERNAGADVSFD